MTSERPSAATSRENPEHMNHENQTGGELAAAPCSAGEPSDWDMVNCPESIIVRINGVCREYFTRWRKLDNGQTETVSAFQEAVLAILAAESRNLRTQATTRQLS